MPETCKIVYISRSDGQEGQKPTPGKDDNETYEKIEPSDQKYQETLVKCGGFLMRELHRLGYYGKFCVSSYPAFHV
jgi:hypothetical protein